MGRRVFFSFHYQRDLWRVNVIRNAWVCRDITDGRFWDSSLWEKTKLEGDDALRRLIRRGLEGTTVTAVLIGAETVNRPWVQFEIEESRRRGNGLLGIYIHQVRAILPQVRLRPLSGRPVAVTDVKGLNPFGLHRRSGARRSWFDLFIPPANPDYMTEWLDPPLDSLVDTYDWVDGNGYENVHRWIERAYERRGSTKL